MSSHKTDLERLSKREAYFSTLATKEGKEARQRAKEEARKGMTESAKDSRWEAKIDKKFADIRKRKARQAKAKLKG
jgi:hypothetical protein